MIMAKGLLSKLFGEPHGRKSFDDYIEVEAPAYGRGFYGPKPTLIKTAKLKDFSDVQKAIEELNQGNILIVNVQGIVSKDVNELKRALETLKGVCQSIGGDIAGIDKDRYIATPQAVKIQFWWITEMEKREFRLLCTDLKCPSCESENTFTLYGRTEKIPYFGEVMETFLSCETCGLRFSDIMCLEQKEPTRYRYKVSDVKDLLTRIVRSSTGTIQIPELGVTITPGPQAEGYISNIEGVLERIADLVKTTIKWAVTDEQKKRSEEVLSLIKLAKDGQTSLTIIIEDPFGNSAIIPNNENKLEREKMNFTEIEGF